MKRKIILVLLALLILGGFVYYTLFLSKPEVYGYKNFSRLPRKKVVILKVKNPQRANLLRVKFVQNGKEFILYEGKPEEEIRLVVEPKRIGLKEGSAEVYVELTRFFFLKEVYKTSAVIDYTPPTLSVIFSPYAVMNGGSGAVRVSVSEESELQLKVGNLTFPLYRVGENTYFSLFAIPLNFSEKDSIELTAVDKVGNETKISIPTRVRIRRYPVYRIELKGREKLLIPKLSTLLAEEVSRENLIKAFKKVNEELRKQNEEQLYEIGRKSEEKIYWKGRFIQMRKSKVISLFGERRIYTYGGKRISESYHWGYDLASVKNAPVEASNGGKVVFAGFLGIYGNTVVIDHGYGLMSIYSHLAEFRVKKGDIVKKGQIIGITDSTGLAFGDHLHFGIMIHGIPVNPIEWWDKKWIENNIIPAIQPRTSR
ncbi:M23 family metallopeptidase [Aquifex pyrophilus]